MLRCSDCTVEFLAPQPSPEILTSIYSDHYFLGEREGVSASDVAEQKSATAALYLHDISANVRAGPCDLLEIGCGHGEFLYMARQQGFRVAGLEVSPAAASAANTRLGETLVATGDIETAQFAPQEFDVIVLLDVLEHVRAPQAAMARIADWLKPGGLAYLVTPDTGSWSRRLMGAHWMEYKVEHLFYFNRRSIAALLARTGFDWPKISPNKKAVSLNYVRAHFRRFRIPFWSAAVETAARIIPAGMSKRPFHIVGSGMVVMARKRS